MPKLTEIIDHVQECSGLVVLVKYDDGTREWTRASGLPISREEVEKLIEKGEHVGN